jgi:hypothetical protein
MLPLGLPDLPQDPSVMPTPSQSKRFLSVSTHAPSTAEIRAATFDARCRASSGFAAIGYRTEVAEEWVVMDANARRLASILSDKDRAESASRAYIRHHDS